MAIFNKQSKTAEAEEQKTEGTVSISPSTAAQRVLIAPRLSEKSAKLETGGKYVFNVARSANKIEVKKAIEQAYRVKVARVNMVVMEGKTRAFGKTKGKRSDFKKAIVTLKPGESITGTEKA